MDDSERLWNQPDLKIPSTNTMHTVAIKSRAGIDCLYLFLGLCFCILKTLMTTLSGIGSLITDERVGISFQKYFDRLAVAIKPILPSSSRRLENLLLISVSAIRNST